MSFQKPTLNFLRNDLERLMKMRFGSSTNGRYSGILFNESKLALLKRETSSSLNMASLGVSLNHEPDFPRLSPEEIF
jgi:hypothetical protein